MQTFYDIHSIATVIGCILNDTTLLKDSSISLEMEDFINRPHKVLFGAILNLTLDTDKKELIDIDIEAYLSAFPLQYTVYTENNLSEYIAYAKKIADKDNFQYCYNNIKKLTLLRELNECGFCTNDIYAESKLDSAYEEKALKFQKMSVQDIIEHYASKMTEVKMNWNNKKGSAFQIDVKASIDDYLESLIATPDIGTPMKSKLLTSITRGNRKKNIYLTSGASGSGKTRLLLSEMLNLATDRLYNINTGKWEKNGLAHNTLFISTELEDYEIFAMCLAFLSGVNESNIKKQHLTEEERDRVREAANILKDINFNIYYISDFDINDITDIIESNIIKNEVDHIALDYIQLTPKTFEYSRRTYGTNLREDQLLTYFLSELKELCNSRNVFIHTSTQLNRGSSQKDTKFDSSVLRGSFAMSDKISYGAIRMPMCEKDYEDIQHIMSKGIYVRPTAISHIFKNRGEQWKNIRVYTHFDLGTLREIDCFATDEDLKLLDIKPLNIEYINTNKEEVIEPKEVRGFDF